MLVETGATLEEANLTGNGFEAATLAGTLPANASVTLHGNFSDVNVAAAKVNVKVKGGQLRT